MKGHDTDDGFVLVEVLVSMAILAAVGVIVYEIGLGLLQRSAEDLDRTSALANLHVVGAILQARGMEASHLLPAEDGRFRYFFSAAPSAEQYSEDQPDFFWAELAAIDRKTRAPIATLPIGFGE